MKCQYCGTEVSENQMFCHYCGTRQMPAVQPKSAVQPKEEPVQEGTEPRLSGFDLDAFEVKEEHAPETKPVREPEPDPRPDPQPAPAIPPLYVMNAPAPTPTAPKIQLPTGRGLAKMIFLGILTLGIYPTVIWSRIVTELNLAASRYDGERTMPYFAMLMLSPITLFIYTLVWMHGFCRRVGAELQRRGFSYKFGASTFWLWNVLGCLILVGPFVFVHKLMKSMNFINTDFNTRG